MRWIWDGVAWGAYRRILWVPVCPWGRVSSSFLRYALWSVEASIVVVSDHHLSVYEKDPRRRRKKDASSTASGSHDVNQEPVFLVFPDIPVFLVFLVPVFPVTTYQCFRFFQFIENPAI